MTGVVLVAYMGDRMGVYPVGPLQAIGRPRDRESNVEHQLTGTRWSQLMMRGGSSLSEEPEQAIDDQRESDD